jgi:hypothetical protein
MRKSLVVVPIATATTVLTPVAVMDGLRAPSAHAASGIPVQLVIVWALLGVIAFGLAFAIVRIVRSR